MSRYELEALQELEEQTWFGAGLRFTCTGCGECCTGPSGSVYVSQPDVTRLSEALGLAEEAFLDRYTRSQDGRRVLTDKPDSSDCVFLSGTACSVYDARPIQCRAYPFWLTNVLDPEAWAETAAVCEGIDHADAILIPASEVVENCRADMENEALEAPERSEPDA